MCMCAQQQEAVIASIEAASVCGWLPEWDRLQLNSQLKMMFASCLRVDRYARAHITSDILPPTPALLACGYVCVHVCVCVCVYVCVVCVCVTLASTLPA